MPDADDLLDRRLRGADPAATMRSSSADLDDLLRRATSRKTRHRRSIVIGAGIVGVIAIGVGATPAAADVVEHFIAQTGWFGDSPNPGGQTSGAWGEEYIDLLAPDTRSFILKHSPSYIPIPAGVSRSKFDETVADRIISAAQQTSKQNDGVGVTEHAILVQRSFEQYAYNDWVRTWIQAHARGDQRTQATAAKALQSATNWPAFVKTSVPSGIALMKDFAHAAETGDETGMQAAAQYNANGNPQSTGWDGISRDGWIKKHLP